MTNEDYDIERPVTKIPCPKCDRWFWSTKALKQHTKDGHKGETMETKAAVYKEGLGQGIQFCIGSLESAKKVYGEQKVYEVLEDPSYHFTAAHREILAMAISTVVLGTLDALKESFELALANIMTMEGK